MRMPEAGWGMKPGSWVAAFGVVTAILGFLFYTVAKSPGYTGTFTLKKGDLVWFMGAYIVAALMLEWKRQYDNLSDSGKVLWVVLWLYVLTAGSSLILLAPK